MSLKKILNPSVHRACLILLCLLLFGCSGQLTVTEINKDNEVGTAINGVPFRIKERYELKLYHLNPVTGTYEQVKKNFDGNSETDNEGPHITMANTDRLFVLKYKGPSLADSNPSFSLNPDGTLLKTKIENQGDHSLEAAKELITQIDAFKEAKTKLDKDSPPTPNLITDELTKKHALENVLAELEALSENATESQVRDVRQRVEKARLELELATAALHPDK
ncbi:MAG: hypothetical protein GY797_41230 [Deltaproteobacteria bacterium]|nr:hypothetical protein [Deltaproteobacteria bacterium]